MIYKGKDPVEGRGKTSEELFADEKTDEKIRRHFSDINDVITEADIENVKTDFGEIDETPPATLPATEPDADTKKPNETTAKDDETEANTIPVITPWNVLKP